MRLSLAVVGLLVAAAFGQAPAPGEGQPRLELSAREWNFGLVWYGDPCETEIQIKNAGAAPLHILDVKSSCGCTAAKPKRDVLGPGESDALHISYNTKKGVKQVFQTITLVTDDPKEREVVVNVKGEVRQIYDMQPNERVSFEQLTREAELGRTMELRCNVPEPVTLTLAPLPANARFKADLQELEPGKRYRLNVATRPPMDQGFNSATITLNTNHPKYTTVTIPVSAYALERVAAVPEKIHVLQQSPSARVQTVRINFLPDHRVSVKSATSDNPAVKVEVMPQREKPDRSGMFEYQILRVSVPAYADMPDSGANVTIVTDDSDPKYQTIVIPVEKLKPFTEITTSGPASPGAH